MCVSQIIFVYTLHPSLLRTITRIWKLRQRSCWILERTALSYHPVAFPGFVCWWICWPTQKTSREVLRLLPPRALAARSLGRTCKSLASEGYVFTYNLQSMKSWIIQLDTHCNHWEEFGVTLATFYIADMIQTFGWPERLTFPGDCVIHRSPHQVWPSAGSMMAAGESHRTV